MNGSQSKFLTRTWHMSQPRPNAPLFWYDQDNIAIEKLLTLETELDNLKSQWKTTIDARKVTCETMTTKIESTNSSKSHGHFTEHLMNVTGNPPHEHNENPKNSAFGPVAEEQDRIEAVHKDNLQNHKPNMIR
jgi:hypothetical protein